MQNWKKLGLIYENDGKRPWAVSHAMLPNVEHLGGGEFRVYYCPRDEKSRSRPACFDFHMDNPPHTYNHSADPLLDLGPPGSFDSAAVMPTCIIPINGKRHMFFNGWHLGKEVPFYGFTGIAEETKDGNFRKLSAHPNALSYSQTDPYSTFSPFVMQEGDNWHMWYMSMLRWEEDGTHFYHIKYAQSDDGLNWTPTDKVCIDFAGPEEYAIARPVVLKDGDIYKMWFSSRALNGIETYRIRYAESRDGLNWERMDHLVGLDVSAEGWDSEMIEYPYVFDYEGKRYMLYNGNHYGATGIGMAVLEDS